MRINLEVVKKKSYKKAMRLKRKLRVRKKINGINIRPRLSVFRSIKEIYVQAIDDEQNITLASASTLDKEIKENCNKFTKLKISKEIGKLLGKKLKEKGVFEAVFDRNGFSYKGRVAALADGVRESGLKF